MVKSVDSNQIQKIERAFIQPIYFLHITTYFVYKGDSGLNSSAACTGNAVISNQYTSDDWLSAGILPEDQFKFDDTGTWKTVLSVDTDDQVTLTSNGPIWEGGPYTFKRQGMLYFSDRNFTYNGHNYETYVRNLSDIENRIRNLGGYDNSILTLDFLNGRFRDKSYLIEFLDENPIEKQYVEVYKLMIDTGEIFGSDVSTLICKAEMGGPYEVTELGFKVDCTKMLFGKNAKLPLDVIDLSDFPGADPDDVGKYRNIPIGNIKKLVCPWTDAGWVSTLTANILVGQSSIEVSDATNTPSTPFTAICDFEEIRVTSKTGNIFTVTKGYNLTDDVPHNKAATIYEKKSTFDAEVAMYPVKSIGDIYVKRGSSEWIRLLNGFTKYISSGGRAFIRFSDKPKFEQEADLDVELTDEPHTHDIDLTYGTLTKECIPNGSSGPTGHANVIDGNIASVCGIAEDETVTATFDDADIGTVTRQHLWVYKADTGGGIKINGSSPVGTGVSGWCRVSGSGGDWDTAVTVTGAQYGNQIAEIYKVVEYTPYQPSASSTQLDPYLTGNSVANMMIGDVVACDVEGYADPDGNYGGVGSLIERPDWVRKLILVVLLGFVAGDIDTSFATIGAIYTGRISGGYKLAFNLPDIATEVQDLFRKIDEQTRSVMFESQGKFKLAFSPTSDPISQLTFANDTDPEHHKIKGDFVFSKTETVDIRNKLRAHYLRDYTKTGSVGEKYQKIREILASASIAKYGEMAEDVEFDCIGDLLTMVDDILDWMIHEKADIKRLVDFIAFWDAMLLDNCDYFTVVSNFWTGHKFRTLKFLESDDRKTIQIGGIEYVA